MKGSQISILILITVSLILMATGRYMPKPFVGIAVLSIVFLSFLRSLYMIRKRINDNGGLQISGLGKVAFYTICIAGFGVVAALMLVVLNIRPYGHLLLNISLVLCLIGILGSIFSPAKTNVGDIATGKLSAVSGKAIYVCSFIMISGMLMKVNHNPAGKLLMYGGLYATMGFLVFLIIWGNYKKKN